MQMPNCYVLGNFFGPNNDAGNRALVVNYQNNTLNPLVNTNQINIEGFINHHLNVLLNGSWRDIDKNLTYFDFKIVPNDQVHRNYKITINGITYYLLIAQRCILRSTGTIRRFVCSYINTKMTDYVNSQNPVIVVLQCTRLFVIIDTTICRWFKTPSFLNWSH